ncbi:MAG: prepilin-type N-terminal cleavage/methylation domain-containing protein [Candidatus Omnitrophica bacterium]|nr:prepilin-type N-terminal cleavage/methylation domain-containing protein [Candidatus Omnitrophota bacterium]
MRPLGKRGFSLIEALISLGIGTVFLTAVYNTWIFSTRSWKEENLNSELRYAIETAMEKIKEDVRLSDGNELLFYPSTAATFSAISLPRATIDSGGFLSINEETGIVWDKTVIYHVYDNAGTLELRRTLIGSFNASSAARQAQLDETVESGEGPSGSETRALFSATDVGLEISPSNMTFDGYQASLARSGNTKFGSVLMAAGNHTIRFQVAGKNDSSSGYRLGIDRLSLTPSGGSQEAETLTVSASNGRTQNIEGMAFYPENGIWSGNYHLEYQSSAVGDYIELQTYYDQWRESNFNNMTHSNTEVTHYDPVLSVMSRENQSLTPSWQAISQTDGEETNQALSNVTVRTVIGGGFVTQSAMMIRFKFKAPTNAALEISSAYFGLRNGSGPNFSAAPTPLYFDNDTVPSGDEDPEGALGAGSVTSKTVPAGHHVWTNWFIYTIDTGFAVPDFLISFYAAGGQAVQWEDPLAATHSYEITGDVAASTEDQTGDATAKIYACAVEEMASWTNTGVGTSQIYDTKVMNPAYHTLTFATNGEGAYSVKVRSSDDPAMAGATDWALVSDHTSSPSALSIGAGRYVQFQATLAAANPYTAYPELDDVTIQWPGITSLVDVSGHFTKRPNYGTFQVQVDGENLVNALGIYLTAAKEYQGREHRFELKAEVNTKNTGK